MPFTTISDISRRGLQTRRLGWLAATLALLLVVGGETLPAQDAEAPATDATPAVDAPVDESGDRPPLDTADDATVSAQPDAAAEPAAPADPTSQPEPPAPDEPAPADESPTTDAPATEDGAAEGVAGSSIAVLAMVISAIVVPLVLGNWIAMRIGMPDHAWKLATLLITVTVASFTVWYAATNDGFKGGPDLSGGITLTYETDKEFQPLEEDAPEDPDQPTDRRRVDMRQLVAAIQQRVDPAGTKEVTIRQSGPDRIEIIIPKQSQDELALVKRRITDLGQLEFRILADPRWKEDETLIKAAKALSPSQKLVRLQDRPAGRWAPYKEAEFPDDGRVVLRQAGDRREALVKLDRYNVTGEYLINPRKSFDVSGPMVLFNFNSKGAGLFGRLTRENLPNRSTGVERRLAISLDGVLISAPNIQSKITDSGQITGIGTEEEVDYLISILDAGSLPAVLNKTPLSEQIISPTIGRETVEKGTYAITVSLAAVLVFILLYYRFAGLVACLALVTNILLVLAVMVLFKAAFTLPGLAGLVLTVGMSVDANVLIFERIREELSRGAALRMAIRNGFARATTTIVDANITTLITGVVLYTIGTGPTRGFAVTLVLGILMSMYTAIFGARVLFDIAERRRWIRDLKFSRIIGATNLDFIGKRGIAAVVSLTLIAVGLTAVVQRGIGMLNIDFTGGTSVTLVFADGQERPIADVRSALKAGVADGEFTVVERGTDGARYTIDSSIEEVEEAEAVVTEAFGDALETFQVKIGDPEAFTDGEATGVAVPLAFNEGPGFGDEDGLTHDALLERVERVAADSGQAGLEPQLENPNYIEGSSQRFKQWTLKAYDVSEDEVLALAEALRADLSSQPLFPVANKISGKVAGDLQLQASYAILVSLIGIVGYLWFRFQNVSFGLAAVVALVHDVLVTLGAIAVSAWVVMSLPAVATALQLDTFQISLPLVAAFLTIIGYSLNDTIVVFDRIREVRGKSPNLTAGMINTSINQTLARTLLTSLTTLLVVVILYFFGGAGIHAFAFALVIGVIVGTYSSIFIASPALLAMIGGAEPQTKPRSEAA